MVYIKDRILRNKRVSFTELTKSCSAKMEIVVTFLALLELIKLRIIRVAQEGNFKEIHLERTDSNEEHKYESN
ncbi:segregation and condensation protein A [Clostridium tetanomorphum]|nr:segregation and condensation protein A [Clostridium tetanomorphum]